MHTDFPHIQWKEGRLNLLDQRKLPTVEQYMECVLVQDVVEAIKTMVVRGAPAIGICAAYGVVLSVKEHVPVGEGWLDKVEQDLKRLEQARPTAVNLMWAVAESRRLLDTLSQGDHDQDAINTAVLSFAESIHRDDLKDNYAMADQACELLATTSPQPFSVITHCNTGSLATGGYGTALGVIRRAWEKQLINQVYADETRPWLQGARLTAWELQNDGVPVILNADSAASWLMREKPIRWAIVGADRITANGDVANKIGTYSLAIQAKYHDVKFMVVAPSSTVDMSLPSGQEIDIEMRTEQELTNFTGTRVAPENIDVINPVFDVTPAELIDVIVTEKGIVERPTVEKMNALFNPS